MSLQNNIAAALSLFAVIHLYCQPSLDEQIDKLFQDYNSDNVPGASLIIIKDGSPIMIKTYGLAHLDDKIAVQSRTNFRLASFTKQFTAMCIAMLFEKGKLNYEQTLLDIFPDFPAYGSEITIDQIIHHTSGLVDYESLISDSATVQVLDKDVLHMMMALDSTYFKPGSQFRYSNTGYAILAQIVEKISGISFAQFLRRHIFTPLKMTNTVAYEKGISAVENRAFGYAVENRKFIFRDQSLTSAVLGDGGIYSSVMDLFNWDQALYTNKLISAETIQKIFRPNILTDGTQTNFGFGWRIAEFNGHRRTHHTGQTCGFTTIIQRYHEDKFSIVILTNRDLPMLDDIANKIAELYLPKIAN